MTFGVDRSDSNKILVCIVKFHKQQHMHMHRGEWATTTAIPLSSTPVYSHCKYVVWPHIVLFSNKGLVTVLLMRRHGWRGSGAGGRSMRYYYYYYYHLTLPQKWKTFGCPIKNSIIHLYFNSLRIIQTRSYEGYDNMARTRQKVQRQESEQWH